MVQCKFKIALTRNENNKMFNWFLRYALLRGLSRETIEICIAHPEINQLVRFRFAYLFAAHAPVLLPLLELLSGHLDPALGVLLLGVASLTMVLADVPTGLYADRAGAKAALRRGLQLTSTIMVGFFFLGLWRAWSIADGTHSGPWLPGTMGLLFLEAAIGVSLALLSGPDTAFFLDVARRSGIPEIDKIGFEGIGSSIRYMGIMFAVGIGSALYNLFEFLIKSPALRLSLQSSLFMLTLAAQWIAIRALRRIPEVLPEYTNGEKKIRPGFREVISGLRSVCRFPKFAAQMWLLCLNCALALFAVYFFQSPLNRLAAILSQHASRWLPFYTIVAIVGYWACSQGSYVLRHHRHNSADSHAAEGKSALVQATAVLGLIAVYPTFVWLTKDAEPMTGAAVLVTIAALSYIIFSFLRGYFEPLSATKLIVFVRQQDHAVPISVISGFNSLKRGMHFIISVIFFLIQRNAIKTSASSDAAIARALVWLVFAFSLALLPAIGLCLDKSDAAKNTV